MDTLDRYVLKEIALPFAIGLGLFFVVVAFAQVLKVSDSVTGLGVGGGAIVQALFYSLPPLLGLLIPVSSLFATLLGIGRIAADREVVGMAAAGVSPYHLLRVPFWLGALFAAASAYALVVGEPWGVRGLRELMAKSAQQALASGVRTGEFQEWVPGVTFLAGGRGGHKFTNVVFADRRDESRPLLITARRGEVAGGTLARDLVFELEDGTVLLTDKDSGRYRVVRFARSRYRLDVGRLVGSKARTLTAVQEKSLPELWTESRDPKKSAGVRALDTITLHRKLALPLATLIFALLAVPLACTAAPGARARGFLYSAGIVGAYYYLGRAVELLARSGRYNPVLAAWTPNLLGLVALGFLLLRLRRRAA